MNTIITKIVKSKALFALVAIFGLSVLLAPAQAGAATAAGNFGLEKIGRDDQLGGVLGKQDLITTITSVIKIALSLLGLIAVVIILAGGFKWMTAGGNEDKVGEAKKMIISGVIGLAIILSAFAIASFVIGSLSDATDVNNTGAQTLPAGL